MVEQRAVCFEWCAVIVEPAEGLVFVVVEDCIIGVVVDVIEVGWDNVVAKAVDNATAVVGLDNGAVFKEVACPFIAGGNDYIAAIITEAVESILAEADGAVMAVEAFIVVCGILALYIAEQLAALDKW